MSFRNIKIFLRNSVTVEFLRLTSNVQLVPSVEDTDIEYNYIC